jgi:XTP/dITP diphosphohydrolase
MSHPFPISAKAWDRRLPFLVASRNPGKVREIRQILGGLGVEWAGLDEVSPPPEPEENGATFADNARRKALHYARALGRWCLADDSGLEVDALGGAPGVRSARYAEERLVPGADKAARDAANNGKLLAALAGVPDDRRTARFVCHVAMADEKGVLAEAEGAVEGRIGRAPRGDSGFGYDPLFLLADGRTMAELDAEAKNRISHRGRALRRLAETLREIVDGPR